jgi:hypothetical protein
MKMQATLSIIIVIGSLAIGCQVPNLTQTLPPAYPKDLRITYGWNTGSLPPRYHYSYEIVIQADGNGQFIYQQSYAGVGAPMPWGSAFTVPAEKISQLYQLLLTKNMLRKDWAKKEPLIGGSSSELKITADGKMFSIPNEPLMIEKDKTDSAEVYGLIKTLVPKGIWDELANKRHQIDAATDAPAQ